MTIEPQVIEQSEQARLKSSRKKKEWTSTHDYYIRERNIAVKYKELPDEPNTTKKFKKLSKKLNQREALNA